MNPLRQLEQEMLGLQVRETADGWRFDHRGGGYSDRAVALAMALSGAARTRRTVGVGPCRRWSSAAAVSMWRGHPVVPAHCRSPIADSDGGLTVSGGPTESTRLGHRLTRGTTSSCCIVGCGPR